MVIGVVLMLALPGEALLGADLGHDFARIDLRRHRDPLPRGANGWTTRKVASLGRFEMPVAIAALIWVAPSLVFLRLTRGVPPSRRVRPRAILAGGVYFAYMMIFNREVLDTEPEGDDDRCATPR